MFIQELKDLREKVKEEKEKMGGDVIRKKHENPDFRLPKGFAYLVRLESRLSDLIALQEFGLKHLNE